MLRRSFLAALAAPLAPRVAGAQPAAKVHRIGYVSPTSPPPEPSPGWTAFLDGLREHGFIDGTNVAAHRRYASGGGPDRVRELLAELVALEVDVIVTVTTGVALEAKKSITHLPIIMAASTDPVGGGVVDSLARPGGNVTGFSFTSPELTGKRLEILKTIAPHVMDVVLVTPSDHPVYRLHHRQAGEAAPALGIRGATIEVIGADPTRWDARFAAIARPGRGLLITDAPGFYRHREKLALLARRHRLPVVYDLRQHVEAGGLLSYGPDVIDVYRRTGGLVGRVLKGAKVSEIPVEQPTKFDFAINLGTARALGLTVPPSLRLRAGHVIE
jgi:putative ABC transport system substrate-binding protein